MKMFMFKLILFTSFLAGSYCYMSIECYSEKFLLQCDRSLDLVDFNWRKPPKTVEDLRNLCSKLIPNGYCTLGVHEDCAKNDQFPDTEEDVENFRQTLDYLELTCNEESHSFKVLSDHINCISSTMETMDNICLPYHMNRTLMQKLYDLESEESGCHIDAWLTFCISAKFDVKCGNDVRDVVSAILFNTDDTYCKNFLTKLSYWEDAFKSEFLRGKSGEDVVPGVLEVIISKKMD